MRFVIEGQEEKQEFVAKAKLLVWKEGLILRINGYDVIVITPDGRLRFVGNLDAKATGLQLDSLGEIGIAPRL